MEKIKVDGHPDLYRDTKSGAIVNKNSSDYENYMRTHKVRMIEKQKMNEIESDLNSIKTEIDEIKFLLKKLIEK
jgi:hypothetical protein